MSKTEKFSIESNLAVLLEKVERIEIDIAEIKETIKKDYVSQGEFRPVKNIVYGLVGIILTAVIGAIISLVVRK